MATSQKRAATSAAVKKVSIDQAHSILLDLPEKNKDELSMLEAMEQLYPLINATLEKGYSLEEVSGLLAKQGLDVNVQSLKYYLSRFKKQQAAPKAKGKGTRKPRATKASSAPGEVTPSPSSVEPAAIAPEPAAPAPEVPKEEKPATRRRATAAPKAPAKSAAKTQTKPTAKTQAKPAEKGGRSPAKAKAEKPAAKTRRKSTGS